MTDIVTLCDVIDDCTECPRYGNDCDGRGEVAREIDELQSANDITEKPNDVVESQNDVIKKPRTVRYKLHKPIEYVSIEFDEEEEITHIDHYTAYGERKEP